MANTGVEIADTLDETYRFGIIYVDSFLHYGTETYS